MTVQVSIGSLPKVKERTTVIVLFTLTLRAGRIAAKGTTDMVLSHAEIFKIMRSLRNVKDRTTVMVLFTLMLLAGRMTAKGTTVMVLSHAVICRDLMTRINPSMWIYAAVVYAVVGSTVI